MKKSLLIFTLFLAGLSLHGCREQTEEIPFSDYGTYGFVECVYVDGLSSATVDYQTQLVQGILSVDLGETTVAVISSMEGTLETYEGIVYRRVPGPEDIDEAHLPGLADFLGQIDRRYDLVDADGSIGYSIFVGEAGMYLAETRMIGERHDQFVLWNIYKIIEE